MARRYLVLGRDNVAGAGGMPGRVDDLVGRLYIGTKFFCPTLENIAHFIADGEWPIKRHDSANHPHTVQILVKGRRNILFHRGSVPPHSLGCVLEPSEAHQRYLEDLVLPSLLSGDEWWCHVLEPSRAML